MATKATATKTAAKRTPAKAAVKSTAAATSGSNAIERKALAMANKSEGMRLLFDAKYTVARVKTVFGAPYGYVYGVALRHGVIATAANRRVAKVTPKTKARTATKVTKVASSRSTKANGTTTSATTRVAAKLAAKAPVKVAGRPTPARRAANRKANGAAAQVSA